MTIKKNLIAVILAASSFTTQAGTMGAYVEPRLSARCIRAF